MQIIFRIPFEGIQADNKVFKAGNVVPSPKPSKTRNAMSDPAPPIYIMLCLSFYIIHYNFTDRIE